MSKLERAPTSKRAGVKKIVEEFLGLVFSFDFDNYNETHKKNLGVQREREIQAEIRGFNKAQEALRDLIAIVATDPNLDLAEIRADGQMQPELVGERRFWIG